MSSGEAQLYLVDRGIVPRGNSEIHLLGASGTATIRDMTEERLSISLGKTGKRLHAIFKPGLWPREVQSLPAPSRI